ncbi:mediator complex subunit [Umbelopsis sp. WA50703]
MGAQSEAMNTASTSTSSSTVSTPNNPNDQSNTSQQLTLPNEMAGMVPLKLVIGKLIHQCYADLHELADTLPSMSEVEKKRLILYYATNARKQFVKVLVLLKWASNAQNIQTCQNIMAFLSNQNKVFQDTVDYLHKIHTELPAARVRNYDIPTAVDILTSGTYLRMPSKMKDIIPPKALMDEEVLQTWSELNDIIRLRMLTTEVLPSPMRNYRIADGRIYFRVENEFEVSLTLMGPSHDRRWWIVSLDILANSTTEGGFNDIDISLSEPQAQRLKAVAQHHLTSAPPVATSNQMSQPTSLPDGIAPEETDNAVSTKSLQFPLVRLYDYVHMFCLNLQLEILYLQSTSLQQWTQRGNERGNFIEISIVDDEQANETSQNSLSSTTVQDELRLLSLSAGIGASLDLSNLPDDEALKVVKALKYPKAHLAVHWQRSGKLFSNYSELNDYQIEASNINVEHLLMHVVMANARTIIRMFHIALISQRRIAYEHRKHDMGTKVDEDYDFEEGVHVLGLDDEAREDDSKQGSRASALLVRYRHQQYVNIAVDIRSGQLTASEVGSGSDEADDKMRRLEERLNADPISIEDHISWLRSDTVISEIVALAKQLNLQAFSPTSMSLRRADIIRIFGDACFPSVSKLEQQEEQRRAVVTELQKLGIIEDDIPEIPPVAASGAEYAQGVSPPQSVFLQFTQYQDWYLVAAVVENKLQFCLCRLSRGAETTSLLHTHVDVLPMNHESLLDTHLDDSNDDEPTNDSKRKMDQRRLSSSKKRRTESIENAEDSLQIDLRLLAKLDSLCRAYITNKQLEIQLSKHKEILTHRSLPFNQTALSKVDPTLYPPVVDKIDVICIPQQDLLRVCVFQRMREDAMVMGVGARLNQYRYIRQDDTEWLRRVLPSLQGQVIIRSSGWLACGKSDCYVIAELKFNCDRIPKLEICPDMKHVALDKTSNTLSFTYTDVDMCVDKFLVDWERTFMMTYLTRFTSSKWLKQFQDDLVFQSFDLKALKFTYGKYYTLSVTWDVPSAAQAPKYMLSLGCTSSTQKDKENVVIAETLGRTQKNPHWRIQKLLENSLNEHKDWIMFIQASPTFLPSSSDAM